MAHRVDMLGTGNAFLPHGRHHSFAMFDRKHIIDVPPTALAGLRRNGTDVSEISTIFITHVHGDHVFGFPFLLLERKYISDREGAKPLRVVGTPFVKERLSLLCQLAFPGSLDSMLDHIEWEMADVGTTHDGWSWERFEVHHDDAVEPHGYRFHHDDGASFVHSGDSGPCESLYDAIERSSLAILEMGFPIGCHQPIITNLLMSTHSLPDAPPHLRSPTPTSTKRVLTLLCWKIPFQIIQNTSFI